MPLMRKHFTLQEIEKNVVAKILREWPAAGPHVPPPRLPSLLASRKTQQRCWSLGGAYVAGRRQALAGDSLPVPFRHHCRV
jgi:hypothetical protein